MFKTLSFRSCKISPSSIRSLVNNIYTGKINIDKAKMVHINLVGNMVEFNDKSRPKQKKKRKKRYL